MKLTLALIAALTAASTASAETATVRLADLDLDSPAGRAELERRIEAATHEICLATVGTGTRIPNYREQRRCETDVRAQIAERLPR